MISTKKKKTHNHINDVISICQNATLILKKKKKLSKTRNRLELSQSYEEHQK